MATRALSESEFKATFGHPMVPAAKDDSPPFDFWPYFEALEAGDFEGHDCTEGRVENVYRESSGRFEHVLVSSTDKNVFMVLVLDRVAGIVHGHRMLNLSKEYGLEP